MVIEWLCIDHGEKELIEKYTVETPLRHELHFDNRRCYIYFKGVELNLFSPGQKEKVKDQESVLFTCGYHYLDLLNQIGEQQVEIFVIHLYPEVLRKIFTNDLPQIVHKREPQQQSQVIASNEIISIFFGTIELYLQNPALFSDDLIELKIKELVLLLVQSKYVDSVLELISDLYSDRRVLLREVIDVHLFSNLNSEELAKLCGLSLSSFKREFKKEFNDSPKNYITTQRLEKAKKLLKATPMSISEIAYEVGFNDPLYFTRVFKKKLGISPSSFR